MNASLVGSFARRMYLYKVEWFAEANTRLAEERRADTPTIRRWITWRSDPRLENSSIHFLLSLTTARLLPSLKPSSFPLSTSQRHVNVFLTGSNRIFISSGSTDFVSAAQRGREDQIMSVHATKCPYYGNRFEQGQAEPTKKSNYKADKLNAKTTSIKSMLESLDSIVMRQCNSYRRSKAKIYKRLPNYVLGKR